ncbi:SAM-dependent methyltransferase [Goodfellowiella coeruleoviolacea]|uniref:S-adenosyl-L-methionine-dependent methyltransferase n=1 Tax=Goodfellowiella coeruleoviolacea TaxID=334858 RepID=A0AAE3KIG8_9PSEU|nr:SAM-dependent methyltransferase [Goodfellowiella coeruleoviolacea]MCP2167962.1 N-methyltransferase [Goodfellowiella coeruleoviolacea]
MNAHSRPPAGVSRTAVMIARARADEQARPDRLFADPLAGVLADAAGDVSDLDFVRELADTHFVLRTRYFDDFCLAAGAARCTQVVVLAAGLDTRAYRLPWPRPTRLFEVDLPALVSFKDRVLAGERVRPACERVTVPADLRGDWPAALLAAGFDRTRPTAWLLEGVMMFLSDADNDRLLARISSLSAPGSRIAIEHFNQEFRRLPQMNQVHERFRSLDALANSWLADPVRWLARNGWYATVAAPTRLAGEHGRPVPGITDPELVGPARIWLASAVRPRLAITLPQKRRLPAIRSVTKLVHRTY